MRGREKFLQDIFEPGLEQGFVLEAGDLGEVLCPCFIIRVERGGQHDHDDVGLLLLPQFPVFTEKFPAVHGGHINIQEDEVGAGVAAETLVSRQIIKSLRATLNHVNLPGAAGLLNRHFIKKIRGFIIIDQQDTV